MPCNEENLCRKVTLQVLGATLDSVIWPMGTRYPWVLLQQLLGKDGDRFSIMYRSHASNTPPPCSQYSTPGALPVGRATSWEAFNPSFDHNIIYCSYFPITERKGSTIITTDLDFFYIIFPFFSQCTRSHSLSVSSSPCYRFVHSSPVLFIILADTCTATWSCIVFFVNWTISFLQSLNNSFLYGSRARTLQDFELYFIIDHSSTCSTSLLHYDRVKLWSHPL